MTDLLDAPVTDTDPAPARTAGRGRALLGLLPFSYTVTSQIAVTFALAALVMGIVIVYGIARHGVHFLHLFAPSGVSIFILPFIVMIEVISLHYHTI